MDKPKANSKILMELLWWLVWASFFAYKLSEGGLTYKRMICVWVVLFIAIGIHIYNSIHSEQYIAKVIGVVYPKSRDYRYDVLRVLAVILVIMTHTIQEDIVSGWVPGETSSIVMTVIYILCLVCNLIYVMLSGALLIPNKNEKVITFYIRRVSRVVWPMVAYYIFYYWQNQKLIHLSVGLAKEILYKLCTGDTPETPHYWLVYTILSIYIVIPILRYVCKSMSYKVLTGCTVVSVVVINYVVYGLSGYNQYVSILAWVTIALVGYWVTREETHKYYLALMGLGAAGLIYMIYMSVKTRGNMPLRGNATPAMLLMAVGLFALIFYRKEICGKSKMLLNILSKYSYSIILVHWWVLYRVTIYKYNIHIMMFHGAGLIVSVLFTLICSLLWAMSIDNFIIVVGDKIFSILYQRMTSVSSSRD